MEKWVPHFSLHLWKNLQHPKPLQWNILKINYINWVVGLLAAINQGFFFFKLFLFFNILRLRVMEMSPLIQKITCSSESYHFMLSLVIRQKQTKLLYFSVTILVFFTQGVYNVSDKKWTFSILSQGNGCFLCFADIVEM